MRYDDLTEEVATRTLLNECAHKARQMIKVDETFWNKLCKIAWGQNQVGEICNKISFFRMSEESSLFEVGGSRIPWRVDNVGDSVDSFLIRKQPISITR